MSYSIKNASSKSARSDVKKRLDALVQSSIVEQVDVKKRGCRELLEDLANGRASSKTVHAHIRGCWGTRKSGVACAREMIFFMNAHDEARVVLDQPDPFCHAHVSKKSVVAVFQNFSDRFMQEPNATIRLAYDRSTGTNNQRLLAATRVIIAALSPISVKWNFVQINLALAMLLSKKCPACSHLNLTCENCAFAQDGIIDNKPLLVQKWISMLPFGPDSSSTFRGEMCKILSSLWLVKKKKSKPFQ